MEPDITPAEFVVLRCLHEQEETDIQQLMERLRHQENENAAEWARTTVLTLLKRLQDKGYVERKQIARRRFVYCPRVTLWQTMGSVFQRFFGSNQRSLLCSYLFHDKPLTPKEKKFLDELLESIKDK